jgi:hypothetical protein
MKQKPITVTLPDGAYMGRGIDGYIEVVFHDFTPSNPGDGTNGPDGGDAAEWTNAETFLIIEVPGKKVRMKMPDEFFEFIRDEAVELADEQCWETYYYESCREKQLLEDWRNCDEKNSY